ncbi:dTDP-4-dehydrorhamnose reductase [Salinicola sp. LHM]|uniref:dTDP-4-dehydrorhamnose reductase n=1 Tax=Salinicola sp. LHM TaxID=3065298 RepID=UPI002ACED807|nr:dTDP-4-dehydrorhamnose reductase [Salinicola sp. LHM]WQH34219.1 dTDP-4-dehydrorhamnose reductase [Salinicola sp. LHM]
MKWLILGSSGQVGRELSRSLQALGRGAALSRQQCDLAVAGEVAEAIARHEPDVVINAAAYTAVDRAEDEPQSAYRVNADAVEELARACAERNVSLVHYSTDYVYSGQGDKPFQEDDATGPLSVYGKSKLAGEQAIARVGARALIFRTSWVYASHGSNFVRTMLRLGRERDDLSVIDDQIGAPTWAATIADVTALALYAWQREQWSPSLAGVYHLTASGATSWHGFAEAVFEEALALQLIDRAEMPRVAPIPSADYPQKAPRPKNSRMDLARLEQAFGLSMPDWRDALRSCLLYMKDGQQ